MKRSKSKGNGDSSAKRLKADASSDAEDDDGGETFLKDQTIAVSEKLSKIDAKLGGDREGLAEKLADAGALVTNNVNKGFTYPFILSSFHRFM